MIYKKQFNTLLIATIFTLALLANLELKAQDFTSVIDKTELLIKQNKFDKAFRLLNANEYLIQELNDSSTVMFYYEKGACLYYMRQFEDALQCLNNAVLYMERIKHHNCLNLRVFYLIGLCYDSLQQFDQAEKYYRRVIIRGNNLVSECDILTHALSELTKIYSKTGNTFLADLCSSKLSLKEGNFDTTDWKNAIEELSDMAKSFKTREKYDEEIDCYQKILSILEEHVGNKHEDYIIYCHILSMVYWLYNRTEESLNQYEHLIEIGKALYSKREEICDAYEMCLKILATKGKIEDIEKLLPEAIEYIQNTKGYDWRNHNLYEIVGITLCGNGNYEFGINYLEREWDGKLPDNLFSYFYLGTGYFNKDPQKSLLYFKKAETLIDDSTDKITRKVIYKAIGILYSNMKNYQEAIRYKELEAPYVKEIDGIDLYAKHLLDWATDCRILNQMEKAKYLCKQVEEILPQLSNINIVSYYLNYGLLEIEMGNYDNAVSLLTKGISCSTEGNGKETSLLPYLYNHIGRAYMFKKDYSNALINLKKSADIQMQINGSVSEKTQSYIKECESK